MKYDGRILGDGDFAQSVLDACKEHYEEGYRLQSQSYDLEQGTNRVSLLLDIDPTQVWALQTPADGQSPQFIVLLGGKKVGHQCHGTV